MPTHPAAGNPTDLHTTSSSNLKRPFAQFITQVSVAIKIINQSKPTCMLSTIYIHTYIIHTQVFYSVGEPWFKNRKEIVCVRKAEKKCHRQTQRIQAAVNCTCGISRLRRRRLMRRKPSPYRRIVNICPVMDQSFGLAVSSCHFTSFILLGS